MSETESSDLELGVDSAVDSDENDFLEMENDSEFEEAPKSERKRKSPATRSPSQSPKKIRVVAEPKKSAVRKPKTEKAPKKKEYSEREASNILLNYVNEQNKPFTANTIFENLHKEIKKPQVVRILADLAKKGKIVEKEYGKSKVYFADQDQFPVVDEAEMKQMDVDIENLAEELNDLKTSIDSLRSNLKDVDLSMSNEALEEGITRMTKENQTMEERLTMLQGAETIDPKELETLRKEITKYQKMWRQRRSQCKEMIGNIAEGLDKKDSEVCEMIGIETEEELGLPLPFKK